MVSQLVFWMWIPILIKFLYIKMASRRLLPSRFFYSVQIQYKIHLAVNQFLAIRLLWILILYTPRQHSLFNSLGPHVATWRRSARPAFPGTDKWRRPLAAHSWRVPTYGDKIIRVTHGDIPSNIIHSYLLTSQQLVLFPFYHAIKMKLTSVVGWNRKHWPDLIKPILHTLT